MKDFKIVKIMLVIILVLNVVDGSFMNLNVLNITKLALLLIAFVLLFKKEN